MWVVHASVDGLIPMLIPAALTGLSGLLKKGNKFGRETLKEMWMELEAQKWMGGHDQNISSKHEILKE